MEISFSNLYLDEMLALQKFTNSAIFDFFSNFSKNPEEAHEIIDLKLSKLNQATSIGLMLASTSANSSFARAAS